MLCRLFGYSYTGVLGLLDLCIGGAFAGQDTINHVISQSGFDDKRLQDWVGDGCLGHLHGMNILSLIFLLHP